jgi:hypothetical protein
MAIAVQLDPEKAPAGCSVPTIVPAMEFEPGKSYELPDEQAQALLALPDGPFMRSSLKAARQQQAATEQETTTATTEPGKPATPEAASTESEAT